MMISAGKLQNRCPGCRAQLLSFFDALLLPGNRTTSRPFLRQRLQAPSVAPVAATVPLWRPNSTRHFSTNRPLRQEPTRGINATESLGASNETESEDIETIVRQARQTFGNTLPPGYLSPEEYRLYERLYGPPLRETTPEDVGIPYRSAEGELYDGLLPKHALLREIQGGLLEEVEYTIDRSVTAEAKDGMADDILEEAERENLDPEEIDLEGVALENMEGIDAPESVPTTADGRVDYLNVKANNRREYNALLKLQRDFEAASLLPAEEIHEEESIIEQEEPREEEEINEDEGEPDASFSGPVWETHKSTRLHEHTTMGRSGTYPSTLQLPKLTFVEPISALLGRADVTHVREAAERVLGGPGLPYGPATPKSKSNLPQKGLQLQAGHHRMSEIEADAFIATMLPGLYASVMSALVEVRKRLGEDWLRGLLTRTDGTPPRVLDVGAGGAGLAAWQDVLQAQWDVLREKGEVKNREPPGKRTVIVGNDNLRHRISRFLHNTTFLPRLPDYVHSVEGSERKLDSGGTPAPRKVFDVIIASHMLMPLEKEYKRKEFLDNLWSMLSPEGGVLIVLEKGHPRGFEAVANVRSRILDEFIIPPTPRSRGEELQSSTERTPEPGMIIAPCTNHTACPMYHMPGVSPGRKDFCHFNQRFIRPPFLQQVLGASHRSHEDIKFSYLAVRRGVYPEGYAAPASSSKSTFLQGQQAADRAFAGYGKVGDAGAAPHALSLPRNILTPLKSRGHVTLDLCTPAGTIERWVVPKSFSKQAYHDARKASWGDLWALGAKTRTARKIRLGRAGAAPDDGGVRARDAAAGRKKHKVVEINVHPQHGVLTHEKQPKGNVERRTKGGRKVKIDDLLQQMGIDELEDPDDKEDAEFMRS
ncbi:Methyltransferase-like protein 17, mitochondrial [Madurella mycetomatis]|uniref:Methyltransferase-like protein 17, mitochondrial n=1 Tax=Madurella mycetomatis TaxID=100816 RepID=A0A175VYT4_9PEZI|nr:Methyltransferase-like protein 17, mitochondrial [Madurella mycetomatis]